MPEHVAFFGAIIDNIVTLTQPAGDLDQSFAFTSPANAATDTPPILSFVE
jgi:hypothetical protein